jgi:RNA polymerase-binding transcription factor DksA
MEEKKCSICGKRIHVGRVEALPDTDTCKRCSREVAKTEDNTDLDGPATDEMIQQARQPDEA